MAKKTKSSGLQPTKISDPENLSRDDGSLDVEKLNQVVALHDQRKTEETAMDQSSKTEIKETAVEDDERKSVPDDEPPVKDGTGEAGDEPESWLSAEETADIGDTAESLGLTEQDLQEFGSRAEFDRYVRLTDRRSMKEGHEIAKRMKPGDRQAMTKEEGDAIAVEYAEAKRRKEEAQKRVAEQPRKDGKVVKPEEVEDDEYEPDFKPDDFDEKLHTEFIRLAKHVKGRAEQRLKQLKEMVERQTEMLQRSEVRAEDMERREAVSAFDKALDSLGHEDLFGKSPVTIGSPEYANREKVWLEGVVPLLLATKARGRDMAITPKMVQRALNGEFADELLKKHKKHFTDQLLRQSRRTLPGGVAASNRKPLTEDEERRAFIEYHRKVEAGKG